MYKLGEASFSNLTVYSRTFIRRRVFVFCPQVLLIGSGDYGCRGKKHGIVSAEVCMSFEAFRNFSMCIYAIQCRVVHSEYISKLGNQARHNACRSIVYNTIQKLYLNSVHDKQYKHKLYWAFETDKNKTYIIQYYSNQHLLVTIGYITAGNTLVFLSGSIRLLSSMVGRVLVSVVSFCCIMGALRNPSAPIPHDSLHSSPF